MTPELGSDVSDAARVEALRRLALDLRSREDVESALRDLVDLVAAALSADAVLLVMVEHERAWSLASTIATELPEIPRAWSLADTAVSGSEDLLVVHGLDDRPERHPWLSEFPTVATLATHVVVAPGGERIGALEVAWGFAREVSSTDADLLRRAAGVVTELLALRAEVSEYARFVELTPNPVATLDLDGAIEEANPAFVALLGYEQDTSLVGRGFLELVAREDGARVTAELARVLFMKRQNGRLTCELMAADGRKVPCSVSVSHLRGPRRHLQVTVYDLSEQRRVAEEHSQLSEQLARAQRLDAVGQIAGGLAHDLNNLLVVMVSNLGLAKESLRAVEGDRDRLDDVREDLLELEVAIERAGQMTSKLLSFARQEEGGDHAADLSEVLPAVTSLIGRSLGEGIHLEVACPERPPVLAVDAVQLERVLVNLVINARDALKPGGGTISIEVEPSSRIDLGDPVTAATGQDGGTPQEGVTVAVRDDGRGMDDAVRARAFEPLFTTRQDHGGSGLGLATVLAFVEESDGEVQLDSAPGEGTTVTLWLPSVEAEVVRVPVGIDVPVAGARVVVVDPGDRTRRVIATMLTGAGYRVNAVASAEAALAAVERDHPDLLLTELALPGAPGTRLIARARDEHPRLRCVAIASVDQPRALDDVPVLVKPFSHDRLLRTVAQVLRTS